MVTRTKHFRRMAVLLFSLIILVIGAVPSLAQTGFSTTTNYDNLPVNHVKIPALKMNDAVFSSTSSQIKKTSSWHRVNGTADETMTAIVYNGPLNWGSSNRTGDNDAVLGTTSISGSFTLRWSNIATLSDGTKADILMTFSNWKIAVGEMPSGISSGSSVYVPIVMSSPGGWTAYTTGTPRTGGLISQDIGGNIGQEIQVTVKILKPGTNTVISASDFPSMLTGLVDLDVPDGTMATNKSNATRMTGKYSEGAALVSGFSGPVYKTTDSQVVHQTVDGNTKIRGNGSEGTETLKWGYLVGASPQGYTYKWYGSAAHVGDTNDGIQMGTSFAVTPSVNVNAVAGTGGTIEKRGTTTYPLNGFTTYDYSPNSGYYVKSLTVDGKAVTLTNAQKKNGGTYTFKKLTEESDTTYDHTINVQFDTLKKITTEVVNGTITPTVTNILVGEDKTISYSPKRGYALKKVTVDGTEVNKNTYPSSYTFSNIQENHTIKVEYEPPVLTIDKKIDQETYHAGDTIHYTVKVKNIIAGSFAENAIVEDAVTSAGQKYVQGSLICSDSAATKEETAAGFKLTIPRIDGGDTVTIEYDAKADSASAQAARATSIANTAKVKSDMTSQIQSSAGADLKVDIWYAWSEDHPKRDLPEGEDERTPGYYDVDTTYKAGDEVYEQNVTAGGKTYPRGTWFFQGWDKNGRIDVWEDTEILGPWTFRPEWNITTGVYNGEINRSSYDIPDGQNRIVYYKPFDGYQLKAVTVDGEDIDINEYPSYYTFTNIRDDHSVFAEYEKIPALEVTKDADRQIYNAGDEVTYTITVKQTVDGAEARGVRLKDVLPEGLTFKEFAEVLPSEIQIVSTSASEYEIAIESLTGEITFSYIATTARDADYDDLVNVAEATADNVPDPARDDAKIQSSVPKPTIEKTVSNENPVYGEEVTYWIAVTEPKPGISLRNAHIEDALPEGVEFVQNSLTIEGDTATGSVSDGILSVDIPSLDESVIVSFKAKITANAGDVDNVATLTGDDTNPLTDNAVLTVKEPEPVITKTASKDKAFIGETVEYTVTAGSEIALLNAVLTDKVPEGIEVDPDSIKCDAEGAEVSFEDGIITVKAASLKEQLTLSYTGKVVKIGEQLNTATLSAENFPKGPVSAEAMVETMGPEAFIEKTASRDKLYPTEKIEFTVSAYLKGVSGGKIEDLLPRGITLDEDSIKVSGIDGLKAEPSEGTIKVFLPDEHISGTVILTYEAAARPDFGLHQNIANLSASNLEDVLSVEASFEILEPSVALTKKASAEKVMAGEDVTYTLNASLVGARDAVLNDVLPEGVSLKEDTLKVEGIENASTSVNGRNISISFLSEDVVTGDAVISYTATVNSGGNHVNKASLEAFNVDDPARAEAEVKGVEPIPVPPVIEEIAKGVETGDAAKIIPFIALLAGAIAILAALIVKRKKGN